MEAYDETRLKEAISHLEELKISSNYRITELEKEMKEDIKEGYFDTTYFEYGKSAENYLKDLYEREINAAKNALEEDDFEIYKKEKTKLESLHARYIIDRLKRLKEEADEL